MCRGQAAIDYVDIGVTMVACRVEVAGRARGRHIKRAPCASREQGAEALAGDSKIARGSDSGSTVTVGEKGVGDGMCQEILSWDTLRDERRASYQQVYRVEERRLLVDRDRTSAGRRW